MSGSGGTMRGWARRASLLGRRRHARLSSASAGSAGAAVQRLRAAMDASVVGQDDVKRALLLGLVAKEHVYVEGPPGVAKTLLAEVSAAATGSAVYSYQFHRDSRLDELVGDRVVVREPSGPGAETIRQSTVKGGILTADICVLDDISRAPGEALNVLLRLLNERRWTDGEGIPLVSAIATANPAREDYFNEPLDPANLDRFTLQVQASGLVHRKDWQDAARVVEAFGTFRQANGEPEPQLSEAVAELPLLHDARQQVAVPERVQRLVLSLLEELVREEGCTASNSLLTDRTFLVKAPRILQASALLAGRQQCTPQDLYALSLLTTFRVPEPVQEQMEAIIQRVLAREEEEEEEEAGYAVARATPETLAWSAVPSGRLSTLRSYTCLHSDQRRR